MGEPPVAGHGHRVRLDADRGQQAPDGIWRCIEQSPERGHWWIQPADRKAREWLRRPHCPLTPVQGHVQYPSRLMRPPDVQALF